MHGNGAHLDDYETHDERRLLPGTGFTIEPGVYFDRFGVRTEINVVWGPDGPEVTGPRQQEIVALVWSGLSRCSRWSVEDVNVYVGKRRCST